ncbi:MAG: nucleotide exchange factor GrpE [Candidatus Schekmanbacteria bacterium]|nr:nucleotide exchange factor GrpE [Candidatus Schekmanbacteria bacterium]
MNDIKQYLRDRLATFQRRIVELEQESRRREDESQAARLALYNGIFEAVDALSSLAASIERRGDELGRSGKRLAGNVQAIRRKLLRTLEEQHIVELSVTAGKATLEACTVVETRPAAELPNTTILNVVRPGYVDQARNRILRKAEVITVRNQ